MFGSVGGGGGVGGGCEHAKKPVNQEPKTNVLQVFFTVLPTYPPKNWETNVLTLAYRSYKIN